MVAFFSSFACDSYYWSLRNTFTFLLSVRTLWVPFLSWSFQCDTASSPSSHRGRPVAFSCPQQLSEHVGWRKKGCRTLTTCNCQPYSAIFAGTLLKFPASLYSLSHGDRRVRSAISLPRFFISQTLQKPLPTEPSANTTPLDG